MRLPIGYDRRGFTARLLVVPPAAIAMLAFMSVLSPARADGVPAATLQAQHAACVNSCSKRSSSASVNCETFCGCIDGQIQKHFTLDQYSEMVQAIQSNRQDPPFTEETRTKYDDMVSACRG